MGRFDVLKVKDWLDRQFDVVRRSPTGEIIEVRKRTDKTILRLGKYPCSELLDLNIISFEEDLKNITIQIIMIKPHQIFGGGMSLQYPYYCAPIVYNIKKVFFNKDGNLKLHI